MKRRWTDEEDSIVQRNWGHRGAPVIGRLLQRSADSVCARANRLGLGPSSRSTLSMKTMMNRTGWTRRRILNAAARAGVRARRLPAITPGAIVRPYAFDEEDAAIIIEQLKKEHHVSHLWRSRHGEWGTYGRTQKPKECLGCNRNDRPHYAKGLCGPCYCRSRRLPQLATVSQPTVA